MKKKRTIYDLLDHIQRKPGMHISSRTLSSLHDFLAGFSEGRAFFHSMDPHEDPPFGEFSAWFSVHYQMSRAAAGGWYGAIMDQWLNDKQAFDSFFEYLAKYRQRKVESEWHFVLTSKQRRLYLAARRDPAPDRLRLTRYQSERCLFLHARESKKKEWYLHTTFKSMVGLRPWLKRVFGITEFQWKHAIKQAP